MPVSAKRYADSDAVFEELRSQFVRLFPERERAFRLGASFRRDLCLSSFETFLYFSQLADDLCIDFGLCESIEIMTVDDLLRTVSNQMPGR